MPNLTEILDRIQAEADAATKGEWKEDGDGVTVGEDAIASCFQRAADVRFTAHARTNVPRLVAAMRVLVEAVERMSRESMDETMGLVADETLGEAQAILEGRDDVS